VIHITRISPYFISKVDFSSGEVLMKVRAIIFSQKSYLTRSPQRTMALQILEKLLPQKWCE